MYAKQNIYSRRRYAIERPNVESVWIEISIHNKEFSLALFMDSQKIKLFETEL